MSLIELSVETNQLSTRLHLDDIKKRASNG